MRRFQKRKRETVLDAAADLYLGRLTSAGYDVDVSIDFDLAPQLAGEAGRKYQLPPFDVTRVVHTRASCFWLSLKAPDGRICGTVAALKQEIEDERLSTFLRRSARNQYPREAGGETILSIDPDVDRASGRLAYIGELKVSKPALGHRKLVRDFLRLCQALVFYEWGVDWTYGFVPDSHVYVGLDREYGFCDGVAAAQEWATPIPERRSSTEWFVASSVGQFTTLAKLDLRLAKVP